MTESSAPGLGQVEPSPSATDASTPAVAQPGLGAHRSLLPLVALGVLTLLLIAVGAVFLTQADQLRTSGPAANKALTDTAATSQVIGQVSTGLTHVLAYDYKNPSVNAAASRRYLTGDAPGQYALLLKELLVAGKNQQLTTTAAVTQAGVASLQGDTARLVVFVNQQSTRADTGASTISRAEVQISAVKQSGTWRISELRPI